MKKIKPYPLVWSRGLDFIPVLSLQQVLKPKKELYHCEAIVSVKREETVSSNKNSIQTELGGFIHTDTINRDKTVISYGVETPTEYRITQKEIFDEITSITQVPEVVVNSRGTCHPIPKNLQELEAFQGSNTLFHRQDAHGNFTNKIRKMFGLPIRNPYYIITNQLREHNIPLPDHHRMRSILKTKWILPSYKNGWSKLDRKTMFQIHKALSPKEQWWTDIALPHPLSGVIDSKIINAQVYKLFYEGEVVAV